MRDRLPRTHFTAYIGNVTANYYRRALNQGVIWEKAKKYNEEQIAKMLNDAYKLGRKEAIEDIELGIEGAKKS